MNIGGMTQPRLSATRSNYPKGPPDLSGQAFGFVFDLLAKAELLNQRDVALGVLAAQIDEQALAPVDHLQQAASAVVVFQMDLEVRRELVDPVGEQGDLHLGRPGVGDGTGVRLDDLGFVFGGSWHLVSMCETERRQNEGRDTVSGFDSRTPVKPTGAVGDQLPEQPSQ